MNKDVSFSVIKRSLSPLLTYAFVCLFLQTIAHHVIAQTCGDGAGQPNCEDAADAGSTPRHYQAPRHVGNPIDVISGNKYQMEADIEFPESRLMFKRHYNTGLTEHNLRLGPGWRHTYHVVLSSLPDGRLQIVQSDGRRIVFSPISDSTKPSDRFDAQAVPDGYVTVTNGYTWHIPDGRRLTFNGSFLTQIEYGDGNRLMLRYDNQLLTSVTDKEGNEIQLNYAAGDQGLVAFEDTYIGPLPGHLSRVESSNGQYLEFQYNASKNLARAVSVDDSARNYKYGDKNYPNHLTHIESKTRAGSTAKEWRYDSSGRSIGMLVDDVGVLNIDYSSEQIDGKYGSTVVNYASGRRQQFVWEPEQSGKPSKVKGIKEQNCATCPTNLTTFAYRDGTVHRSKTRKIQPPIPPPKPKDPNYDVPIDIGVGVTEKQSVECDLNYVALCDRLEEALDYAELSKCSYSMPPTCAGGWVLTDAGGNLSNGKYYEHGDFSAGLYYHPVEDRYVVAFTGTNEFSDLDDSIGQAGGNEANQYADVRALVNQLNQSLPGADFTFTGHSLGGGLATYASWLTGYPAFVFNPSAVSPELDDHASIEYGALDGLVDSVIVKGDPLSDLLDNGPNRGTYENEFEDTHPLDFVNNFPAPGRTLLLDPPSETWLENNKVPFDHPLYPDAWDEVVQIGGAHHIIIAVIESIKIALVANNC